MSKKSVRNCYSECSSVFFVKNEKKTILVNKSMQNRKLKNAKRWRWGDKFLQQPKDYFGEVEQQRIIKNTWKNDGMETGRQCL